MKRYETESKLSLGAAVIGYTNAFYNRRNFISVSSGSHVVHELCAKRVKRFYVRSMVHVV